MKRSISKPAAILFSLAFSGFSASALHAAESYQLAKKGFVPPVGTVRTQETTVTTKDSAMTIQVPGQEIAGKANRSESHQEIAEVISPAKVRVTIKKSEVAGSMTVNGQDQETPEEPNALLNLPFILELKDGKWSASLESGAEPTAKQKDALKKKEFTANQEADVEMYGSTPRKVGDEWKADPSKIGIGEGAEMKGDYTVKFVEVKEVGGVKCAVLKATFDFKGNPGAGAGGPSSLAMKGEAVSVRSIADMADLEVKMTGSTTVDVSPQEGVQVHIVGPTEMIQKSTLKKP